MRNGVRFSMLAGLLILGVCASLSSGFAAKELSTDGMKAVFGGCTNKQAFFGRPCNMNGRTCITVEDCMPSED